MSQTKLETYPLWIKSCEAARNCRILMQQLDDDEEWLIRQKLKQNSFALTDTVAEAYGALDPRDKEYAFGQARRASASLYNVSKQVEQFGLIEGGETLVEQLQIIIDLIDDEITESGEAVPAWLNRYEKEDADES